MLVALLFTCARWIGLWDLHAVRSWDIGSIAFYFSMAASIYLNARGADGVKSKFFNKIHSSGRSPPTLKR